MSSTILAMETETSNYSSSMTFLRQFSSSEGVKIALRDLNPHFVCVLCFGYFVDATTITECMHTFCKSCIVNFLQTNHHCPHCDISLSRTRPFSSLRYDRVMQTLVYKTVPGLFQTEMRRRLQYYQSNPHQDSELDVGEMQNYVFGPEDFISLSIGYYNVRNIPKEKRSEIPKSFSPENCKIPVRYFRCPATVPVRVLKSLIRSKYNVSDLLKIELLYGDERLLDSWTLMEVAYIFRWPRESPMELTFQIIAYRKVRRKRLKLVRRLKKRDTSHSTSNPSSKDSSDESNGGPPLKMPRLDDSKSSTTTTTTEVHHHRPPTPPETPEGANDIDNEHSFQKSLSIKIEKSIPGDSSYPLTEIESQHMSRESKLVTKIQSDSEGEDILVDVESTDFPDKENSLIQEYSTYDDSLRSQGEMGDGSRPEDSPGDDYACDHDSEAPLEVDTSHDTEPENELSDYVENQNASELFKNLGNYECEEEEPGDSTIDVTETCSVSAMDSDEKEIDFNVSTESVDLESNPKRESDHLESCHEGSSESVDSDKKDKDIEKESAKRKNADSSDTNDLGVLDLSSHARSVRAKRENGDSSSEGPSNTPSPDLDPEKGAAPGDEISVSPNGTSQEANAKRNGKDVASASEAPNIITIPGHPAFAHPTIVPRPSFPIDWTRPPLGTNAAVNPYAFRDLMTLSHAAVQVHAAVLAQHAQVQAQAQAQAVQVQAQQAQAQAQAQAAQKIQAQVQANILKNLKATETLSFVNGSGDTLTISPIPVNKTNSKPKTHSKYSSKFKVSNQTSLANSKASSGPSSNQQTKVSIKHSVTGSKPIKNQATGGVNKMIRETPLLNGNSIGTTAPTRTNNTTAAKNVSSAKPHPPGSLKTIIPKSVLTSLKIPNLHINTTKMTSSIKQEKEKKEHDKDKNRTGDPVFKITNQKIIEYVRQQHLNNKMKRNINNNNDKPGSTCDSSNNKNTVNSPTTINGDSKCETAKVSTVNSNPSKSVTSTSSAVARTPIHFEKPVSNPSSLLTTSSVNKTNPTTTTSSIKTTHNSSTSAISKVAQPPIIPVIKTKSISVVASVNSTPSSTAYTSISSSSSTNTTAASSNKTPTTSATNTSSTNQVKITSNGHEKLLNGKSNPNSTLSGRTNSSSPLTPITSTPRSVGLSSEANSPINTVAIRTTNNSVRQIPNPSRLLQQSENRISAGIGRAVGGSKKPFSSTSGEGLSRIESLTRSLHEKVAASARMSGGVVNTLAR